MINEDEAIDIIVNTLKKHHISGHCAIWCAGSAYEAGHLDEFLEFIQNEKHLNEDILFEWDFKNNPREPIGYNSDDDCEYVFMTEEEEQKEYNRLVEQYQNRYKK